MALRLECPGCGHRNVVSLDELLGKYAECSGCRKLIYVVTGSQPQPEKEGGSSDTAGTKTSEVDPLSV